MVGGAEKRKRSGSDRRADAGDRISDLPDPMIHHILSFLEMRDVIKTCLLSRRWRHAWKFVPVLDFGYWWSSDPGPGAAAFIGSSLAHFEGRKIRRFKAHILHKVDPSLMDLWISFAVRCDVEELDIYLQGPDEKPYNLPRCVFDCGALRVLKAGRCDLDLSESSCFGSLTALYLSQCVLDSSASFCFRSLTKLHLYEVELTDLDTSGCPLLEILIMEYCSNCLNVYAPNQKLRYLKLASYKRLVGFRLYAPYLLFIEFTGAFRKFYEFKDLSSITSASLDFYNVGKDESDSLVELLERLGHARTLKLSISCMKMLTYKERENLGTSRICATHLELETNVKNKSLLPAIAFLLRSSHCLQTLVLSFTNYKEINDNVELEPWESLELALSAQSQLKTVMIHKFLGIWAEEIELVEILLKCCKMLDKMIISTTEMPSLESELLPTLEKKLRAFPRASANAEIYFSWKPAEQKM